jgi:WG containing repeat
LKPAALALLAGVWMAADGAAQCQFSPLEPGPSALERPAPRKVFPVDTPSGDTRYIDKSGKPAAAPAKAPGGLTIFKEFVDGHPRYGYRDGSGAAKIPPRFLDALEFSSGLAGVKDVSGKWGFIDETGAMRIAPQFEAVADFSSGLAAVDRCGSCAYIDSEGKQAFSGVYRHCYRFEKGVAKVELTQGHWGFIDKTGKLLARLSDGGEFALLSEGLMPSEKEGGGIGFVDLTGKFVVAPRFAFVEPFSEGLAAVKEDKAWGYVDNTGKYVIAPQFCDPADSRGGYFHEGLAFVCDSKSRLYGFIGRDGKYVIPPQFGRCNDPSGEHCEFDGGMAWVETKKLEGYVNPKGSFVWSRSVGHGR